MSKPEIMSLIGQASNSRYSEYKPTLAYVHWLKYAWVANQLVLLNRNNPTYPSKSSGPSQLGVRLSWR